MAHLARNPSLYAKPIGMSGTNKPPGVADAKFPSQWWGFNWFGVQNFNGLDNPYEFADEPKYDATQMRYLAWHYEQNGHLGRVHQSGVVYFNNRVSAAQAKAMVYGYGKAKDAQFYALRAHTDTQAFVDYHIKEEQRVADPNTGEADVYVFGDRPQYRVPNGTAAPVAPSQAAQQRAMMVALARDISIPMAVLSVQHPDEMVKFYKEVSIARKLAIEGMDTNPVENLQVFVFYGEAGAGKSSSVEYNYRKYFGHLGQFHLSTSRSGEMWWDMYDGEACIVLDDYDGSFKLDDFKTLVSEMCAKRRWQVKGGHTRAKPQVIFITSNKHPVAWYPNASEADQAAVLRRCRQTVAMTGELDSRGNQKRGPDGKPIPQVYDVVERRFVGGIDVYKKILQETSVDKVQFYLQAKAKAALTPAAPAASYMSPAREDKALEVPKAPARKMPVAPKLTEEEDDTDYRSWLKPRKLFASRVFPDATESDEETGEWMLNNVPGEKEMRDMEDEWVLKERIKDCKKVQQAAKKRKEETKTWQRLVEKQYADHMAGNAARSPIVIEEDSDDDCVITQSNCHVINDDDEDTEGESIGSEDSYTDDDTVEDESWIEDTTWLDDEMDTALEMQRGNVLHGLMKGAKGKAGEQLRSTTLYKKLDGLDKYKYKK